MEEQISILDAFKTITIKLTGTRPLIMHNGDMANNFNYYTKELKKITSKRKKVDADYEQMAKLEWYGGLYQKNKRIGIPGDLIEATFYNAAKKLKKGKTAQSAFQCNDFSFLEYDGIKDIDKLWEDKDYTFSKLVKINQSRISRMRPIFNTWSLSVVVKYDSTQFEHDDIIEILKIGGNIIGLGDWRPKYGLFDVEEV